MDNNEVVSREPSPNAPPDFLEQKSILQCSDVNLNQTSPSPVDSVELKKLEDERNISQSNSEVSNSNSKDTESRNSSKISCAAEEEQCEGKRRPVIEETWNISAKRSFKHLSKEGEKKETDKEKSDTTLESHLSEETNQKEGNESKETINTQNTNEEIENSNSQASTKTQISISSSEIEEKEKDKPKITEETVKKSVVFADGTEPGAENDSKSSETTVNSNDSTPSDEIVNINMSVDSLTDRSDEKIDENLVKEESKTKISSSEVATVENQKKKLKKPILSRLRLSSFSFFSKRKTNE